MQGKHRIPSLCAGLLAFLLVASAFLLFVGSSGKARAESATIVTHQTDFLTIPQGQTGTQSVSCASGEQLLSGGFYDFAFEQAAFGVSSYPSASDTWTVTVNNAHGPDSAEVEAFVYCLQANYSLGTTIVQAANTGSGLVTASCPASSTLIGGGYSGTRDVVTTTGPNGNGWQTDDGTAYAICATQNMAATSLVSTTFTTPANSSASGATATCASGQLAIGGGFSGSLTNHTPIYLSESGNGNAGWSVGAGGLGYQETITVWAICTSFPVIDPLPTITPTTPAPPVQITYQVVSQWSGGFEVIIKICNISSQPISGWTLQFTFPDDQQITQGWNGNVNQSGELVTITNAGNNGLLEPGQCITLGFIGTWTTSNASPTSFLFNGMPV